MSLTDLLVFGAIVGACLAGLVLVGAAWGGSTTRRSAGGVDERLQLVLATQPSCGSSPRSMPAIVSWKSSASWPPLIVSVTSCLRKAGIGSVRGSQRDIAGPSTARCHRAAAHAARRR